MAGGVRGPPKTTVKTKVIALITKIQNLPKNVRPQSFSKKQSSDNHAKLQKLYKAALAKKNSSDDIEFQNSDDTEFQKKEWERIKKDNNAFLRRFLKDVGGQPGMPDEKKLKEMSARLAER